MAHQICPINQSDTTTYLINVFYQFVYDTKELIYEKKQTDKVFSVIKISQIFYSNSNF
jgi:hypothetical protein